MRFKMIGVDYSHKPRYHLENVKKNLKYKLSKFAVYKIYHNLNLNISHTLP